MSKKDIVFIIGTRPELIKMAPVIHALQAMGVSNFSVVNTGQHKELLTKYWKIFKIEPDFELDIISHGQDLSGLTVRAISKISELLSEFINQNERPKIILAQGDTTTVMAASIVAFYNKIKFIHLEAGLRSHDMLQPFPEELNRKIASIVAHLHLAPTPIAKENLLRENVLEKDIHVVGNTIVDSLEYVRMSDEFKSRHFNNPLLNNLDSSPLILITCHRRENHGDNLRKIISALEIIVRKFPTFHFVWIWHPNPNVKQVISNSELNSNKNFLLIDPLDYWDLLRLMSRSSIVITDSGGIQEEAPSFGKPLIVLREVTERPEAVLAGMAKLVGADTESIVHAFDWALKYEPTSYSNPYGDGKSSPRIARLLIESIG